MKKISSDNGRFFVYSFSHLCVDALCCYLLYQLSPSPVLWILVYHGIAFALQPVIGYVTDRYHHFNYGLIAMIFIGLSWAVFTPLPSVILAGLGNALFHLEGGYVSLHRKEQGIRHGGIFVGPGALGIGIGTVCGKFHYLNIYLFLILFFLPAFLLILMTEKAERKERTEFHICNGEIIPVFLSVVIRGYAGFLVPSMADDPVTTLLIFLFSMLGKMLGGILSEKLGVRRVSVISQLLCIITLPLCYFLKSFVYVSVFLINIPMAVTLCALCDCAEEHTGFAFGLAPLGLFIGFILKLNLTLPSTVSLVVCMVLCGCSASLFHHMFQS